MPPSATGLRREVSSWHGRVSLRLVPLGLELLGMGLIITGLWLVWPPLGLLTAGLACVVLALAMERLIERKGD